MPLSSTERFHKRNIKVFSKKYRDSLLFRQALKSAIGAYEISKQTNFFATPAVLDYSKEDNVIHFEFIENGITISKILRSYNYLNIKRRKLTTLFYNIGTALSEYHTYSGKPHGDFSSSNVLINSKDPSLIYFVDFSPPSWDNNPDQDSKHLYKDLALFSIIIKLKYPFYLFPLAFRRFNEVLCQQFYRGYVELSQLHFNKDVLIREINCYKKVPSLKNTLILTFFDWIPMLKIRGYKSERG